MTATRTPQTRPAVAIRQAARILGTDEADVAQLVKSGKLTEMYTKPTIGEPCPVYNTTELEALAEVAKLRKELETMTASRDLWRSDVKDAEAAQAAARAQAKRLQADRDRAREIAVALEQEQANAWIVPKVALDDNPYVRPRILGNGLIRRDSGDSTPEHTRRFVAQCLAAADEVDNQAKETDQ